MSTTAQHPLAPSVSEAEPAPDPVAPTTSQIVILGYG